MTKNNQSTVNDWPAYWFVALERAIESGDFEQEEQAKRELERLGVEVTFRKPHGRKGATSR